MDVADGYADHLRELLASCKREEFDRAISAVIADADTLEDAELELLNVIERPNGSRDWSLCAVAYTPTEFLSVMQTHVRLQERTPSPEPDHTVQVRLTRYETSSIRTQLTSLEGDALRNVVETISERTGRSAGAVRRWLARLRSGQTMSISDPDADLLYLVLYADGYRDLELPTRERKVSRSRRAAPGVPYESLTARAGQLSIRRLIAEGWLVRESKGRYRRGSRFLT